MIVSTLSTLHYLAWALIDMAAVYYPPDIFGKIMWPNLADYSPETAYLVSSYAMNNNDITDLLAQVYSTANRTQVCCKWIQDNEITWKYWIRPCKLGPFGE